MKRNSRLSLALHTLGHMADHPERFQTSAEIAEHAGTNAVVVRRVLGPLRKAGLLTSEKGHSGGWKLARDARSITLADVYVALDEQLIPTSNKSEKPKCSVEGALHDRVSEIMFDVEKTLIKRFSEVSIVEMRGSVSHVH